MTLNSRWTKNPWACEDCGRYGEDWGAPDCCPRCGSSNITTDVASVEQEKNVDLTEGGA